jgi:hypothetical protein
MHGVRGRAVLNRPDGLYKWGLLIVKEKMSGVHSSDPISAIMDKIEQESGEIRRYFQEKPSNKRR